MTVVVGVDGAGRTHRLREIAASREPATWVRDGAELPAGQPDGVVVVDDAHRLPPELVRRLAAAARNGMAMVISRRPTLDRPELAELDEAVAGQGPVELLGPLDDERLAALISTVTGRPAPPERVAEVRAASAGLAAIAALVAAGRFGELAARVQRRLARLEPEATRLARVLALRLDLTDQVLAGAAGIPPDRLPTTVRWLRDEGLLTPDGERMIPAVADAVLAELTPAERRRLHDAVAGSLVDSHGDPVAAAAQLVAARARGARAAQVYGRAGDRLRFDDPATALTWYDEALDAGADPETVAAGRAEAAALLGQPVDQDGAQAPRVALAAGASAAHQGRADRAGQLLRTAATPGPLLAVPSLVATGDLDAARAAATEPGAPPLRRFAEAALAIGDPAAALPLLIEAAEAVEIGPPAVVLPDTPHALAALVAVTAGDPATAEHLLERALATGAGGPVAADRHRLLLAWIGLRTGRYDPAHAAGIQTVSLTGRERLLAAALSAGIARRTGDVARLREAWAGAEPVLARRAVDLFHVEPLEELLVAAARLRQPYRVAPVLDTLDAIVDRLGRPAAWAVSVGWIRLQVAVATDDPAAAAAAAERIDGTGIRQRAQAEAARRWAAALAGEVDPDRVVVAADRLAEAQLPWEASRLAGHAAIRTPDGAAARRLLEHARELGATDATVDGRGSYGGLSEREVEVARLVLEGRTHREIGSQLYLSPKTVEHHVARIRTKLGATSRAELLAALRNVLSD